MKSIITAALLISALYSQTTFAAKNPFKGTWVLVSGEYVNDKKEVIDYEKFAIESQKVIADNHFSFVSFSKEKFYAAGTGSYTFSATEYSEKPKLASYPLEDGGTYVFKYTMEGDYWHNSRWRDGKRVEYEVWKKVK